MLPEGYSECEICSTPTHGDICRGCAVQIQRACELTGFLWLDDKTRGNDYWILVEPEKGGRKRWMKHWKLLERALQNT